MRPADPSRPAARTEGVVVAAKRRLRERVRNGRLTQEPESARQARTRLALRVSADHRVVAAYASIDPEPTTWDLINALDAAGVTVLLPVLGRRPDGSVRRQPDWAPFDGPGHLRPGYAGVPEPTTDPRGPSGLARATLIWCAGLAASPSGQRLGTGGGWYDRALGYAAEDAVVGVLLRDGEVFDAVPTEPFDRPVDVVVTERRVLWTSAAH